MHVFVKTAIGINVSPLYRHRQINLSKKNMVLGTYITPPPQSINSHCNTWLIVPGANIPDAVLH